MRAQTLTSLLKHMQGKHPQKAHGRGGGGKVVALSGMASNFVESALEEESRALTDDGMDKEAKAVDKISSAIDDGKPLSKAQRTTAHDIVGQRASSAESDAEVAAFDKALAALS